MRIPCPSDDLLGEIQATLAALADLECSYEIDQERLKQGSLTDVAWQHLRVERERRHQQECEPYMQQLNQLQHRMRILTSSV
jgi:outer membrane protein TolC